MALDLGRGALDPQILGRQAALLAVGEVDLDAAFALEHAQLGRPGRVVGLVAAGDRAPTWGSVVGAHGTSFSTRASLTSMIGMPSRIGIGQPRLAADQLAGRRIVFQRPVRQPGRPGFPAASGRRRRGGGSRLRSMQLGWPGIARPGVSWPAAAGTRAAGRRRPSRGRRSAAWRGRSVSAASSSACFSAGPNGSIIDSEVTRLRSPACFTASQSVDRLRLRKKAASAAISRSRSSSTGSSA